MQVGEARLPGCTSQHGEIAQGGVPYCPQGLQWPSGLVESTLHQQKEAPPPALHRHFKPYEMMGMINPARGIGWSLFAMNSKEAEALFQDKEQ